MRDICYEMTQDSIRRWGNHVPVDAGTRLHGIPPIAAINAERRTVKRMGQLATKRVTYKRQFLAETAKTKTTTRKTEKIRTIAAEEKPGQRMPKNGDPQSAML